MARNCLDEFEIKEVEGLTLGESIGAGAFGAVYEVKVNGIKRIAKRLLDILLLQDIPPEEKAGIRKRFYDECLHLSKLNHPNVVEFVGVFFDNPADRGDVTLIMECLHTDLSKFLEQRHSIPLSVKLSILHDIASGLLYLHTSLHHPLIHRDLTAPNILLTVDVKAKICDLGLSKLVKNFNDIHTRCPGTLAYMPPEALYENPIHDVHLDVFSFGHLALYAAIENFPEVYNIDYNDPAFTQARLVGEIEMLRRKRWMDMLGSDHCLRELICHCLQDNPKSRLSTKSLKSSMKVLCVQHPKSLNDVIISWGDPRQIDEECMRPNCCKLKRTCDLISVDHDRLQTNVAKLTQMIREKVGEVRELQEQNEVLQGQLKSANDQLELANQKVELYEQEVGAKQVECDAVKEKVLKWELNTSKDSFKERSGFEQSLHAFKHFVRPKAKADSGEMRKRREQLMREEESAAAEAERFQKELSKYVVEIEKLRKQIENEVQEHRIDILRQKLEVMKKERAAIIARNRDRTISLPAEWTDDFKPDKGILQHRKRICNSETYEAEAEAIAMLDNSSNSAEHGGVFVNDSQRRYMRRSRSNAVLESNVNLDNR